MLASLTFPLAAAGFAMLAACASLAAARKCPRWLTLITAGVIVVHVALVWSIHYDWSFATATRNGYFGFALFHAALLLIIAAVGLSGQTQRWLLIGAFLIVSIGANGAVYRYADVAYYRIPVHAITLAGLVFIFRGLRRKISRA